MQARITFNGKDYASIDEMPADERRRYDLVMKNLRPLVDGTDADATTRSLDLGHDPGVHATVRTRIVVNDHTYNSPDELPPELRQRYEEAMRSMGTGAAASGKHVSFSVVSGKGSAGLERQTAGAPLLNAGQGSPDPGTIRVEFSGRALLAVASLVAIGGAAWFLFGSRLFGHR